jgi:DNA sulfur modification protein DndD
MFINKIVLSDYRIYKGSVEVSFNQEEFKNVYVISGNNGYGKTSFLTSLVWCFYGKNMMDVEKKYREDVSDSGGYKKYAKSCLNISSASESVDEYTVSITLTDVFIPSVPCDKIEIIRTYNVSSEKETLRILIDGAENELTKEVGNDIFINDFLLPREIAKFFFFDAEKIVALAEITSVEDKRALSKAYSEVLGIKKYEDLKSNLQDLRVRLRRSNSSDSNASKLDELRREISGLEKAVQYNAAKIENLNDELQLKRLHSDQLQERLIREGNAISISELAKLKSEVKILNSEAESLRHELDSLSELAPFAIGFNLLSEVIDQIAKEGSTQTNEISQHTKELIKKKIVEELKKADIEKYLIRKVAGVVEKSFNAADESDQANGILELEANERNIVMSVFNKLKYSYSQTFKEISKAYKSNRTQYNKIIRKLSEAESKENDLLIKDIRLEKNKVDDRIQAIYEELARIKQGSDDAHKEIVTKSRIASEIEKKIHLFELDLKKDETAARLISELQGFISKLKGEKKYALESKIKDELNSLMHKKDFVNKVEVVLENDLVDILLFRKSGSPIEKEKLSKGEQQLYATALLKALVSESNFKFPVFIDSPLQKFDRMHSSRIIKEFYPSISEQVVLFPLLEKELSEKEYGTLVKKVAGAYIIKNVDGEFSYFKTIEPKALFTVYNTEYDTIN